MKLREQDRSDMDKLVSIAQSHLHVKNKNILALHLLNLLCGRDGNQMTNEDKAVLTQLAMLVPRENSVV
eukprot:Awhi_evm1s8705